jgi:hypothetical protein
LWGGLFRGADQGSVCRVIHHRIIFLFFCGLDVICYDASMSIVNPPRERHSSSFRNGLLFITISAPRHPDLLFSIGWLFVWSITFFWAIKFAILFSLVIFSQQTGSVTIQSLLVPLFFIFWLIFWGRAGFRSIKRLLWHLFGEEETQISDSLITIKRRIFGRGRPKSYQSAHIERLRVACHSPQGFQKFLGEQEMTCLAFDYGSDTIRFGVGIAEAEARRILEKVQEHFPMYENRIMPE